MDKTPQSTARFIEQAEYIDKNEFRAWSATHPQEATILKKLSAVGAKLVTGPRGCGKTTLLLKAYYKLLSSKDPSALPVYANFKTSLKIEPLYHKNANANYWFNQWLIMQILLGLYDSLAFLNAEPPELAGLTRPELESMRDRLELGITEFPSSFDQGFDISLLKRLLTKSAQATGRARCVLLLDDAAHAFSADQQRDFFDFFRRIKSREISPKAAIYPGVTIYSSAFHVGHDAEEINVWVRPDSNDYLGFMRQLLEKRLDDFAFKRFSQ